MAVRLITYDYNIPENVRSSAVAEPVGCRCEQLGHVCEIARWALQRRYSKRVLVRELPVKFIVYSGTPPEVLPHFCIKAH